MSDYLGDVQTAMRRYDNLGPGVAQIDIDSSDQHASRYGVKLWNLYGKWFASERTLAGSIHLAIDLGIIDRFGFDEQQGAEIAGRAELRAAANEASR